MEAKPGVKRSLDLAYATSRRLDFPDRSVPALTYGIRNRGLMGIGARISLDGGETWRPPWVIRQFGDQATDIGYPSTVALDKKGNLLTAFYTDYEPSLGKRARRYRVLGHELVDQGLVARKLARLDFGRQKLKL